MKVGFSVLAGIPQERDREIEFTAEPLPGHQLAALIDGAADDLERWRGQVSVADLLVTRRRPARGLEASGLTMLLIAWGHAVEHLAQVKLTRQFYDEVLGRP